MNHVTCPACGWQTLESVEIMMGEMSRGLSPRQSTVLFECNRCAWFGTALITPGPQTQGSPSR